MHPLLPVTPFTRLNVDYAKFIGRDPSSFSRIREREETEIGERSIREGGCLEEFGNLFSAMKVISDRPKCSRLDGPGRDVEVCSNRKNKMAERAVRQNEKRGIRCVTSLILIAPPARNSG